MEDLSLLIAGGGSGLGALLARMAADDGAAKVGVIDINPDAAEAALEPARAKVPPAAFAKCDIQVGPQCHAAFDAIASKLGRIDTAATKAAVASLTRSVVQHVAGDGILVNSVAPAGMATQRARDLGFLDELAKASPLGRGAKPAEIAEWVLMAGGPRNTYTTGKNIIVSGGYVYA